MNCFELSTGVCTASAVLFFFETYRPAWLMLAGLLGLSVGSFINVVAYRLPLMFTNSTHPMKVNLCFPRSFCPQCHHPIAAQDNLPVIGYMRLRGQCRNCQSSIGIRYPIVEGLTGCLCVVSAGVWGPGWTCLMAWFFTWVCIAIALILWDVRRNIHKASKPVTTKE